VLAASIINALMMQATSTSETSVSIFHAIRRSNPEDSHLHTCLENLKFQTITIGYSKNKVNLKSIF
jgi:hypothetical protein